MPSLDLLKTLHIGATVLLLAGAVAVIFGGWRGWRAGQAGGLGQTLQRPWLFGWWAMGVSLLVFPFSGWWLVHGTGWSLGQTWLLAGTSLYTLGILCWLWLLGRVNRLRQAGPQASVGQRRWVLALAAVGGAILAASLTLMIVKPA
jgi:uncharacterized membrane protein